VRNESEEVEAVVVELVLVDESELLEPQPVMMPATNAAAATMAPIFANFFIQKILLYLRQNICLPKLSHSQYTTKSKVCHLKQLWQAIDLSSAFIHGAEQNQIQMCEEIAVHARF
jgi:hypothetical protein